MKTNASFSFLLADLAHSKHGVCCRPRQNIYYLSSVMCEWRTKWTCVTERVCVSALVDECTPSARQAKNSNTHTHTNTHFLAIFVCIRPTVTYCLPFQAFSFPFSPKTTCVHLLSRILVLPPWDARALVSLLLPFKGFDITFMGHFLFF